VEAVAGDAVAAVNGSRRPLSHITVQWHILDRCNLRCKHCYQEAFQDPGFELPVLLKIADRIFKWHEQECERAAARIPLFLNLTGGEPCLHPDFPALLHYLKKSRPRLGILSNGILIDEQSAGRFAESGVRFVQLSVEGGPETHDEIRGGRSFAETIKAGRILKKAGIRLIWSFTAHSANFMEFATVAEIARSQGVDRLWTDRLIPASGADAPRPLDALQTQDYLRLLEKARRKAEKRGSGTEIFLGRALQFQAAGGRPYHCRAGRELVAIMPNGDLYPCRRLPLAVGNVLDRPLEELYATETMERLRSFTAPAECGPCLYKHGCQGGLRCLAQAVTGDMFRRDPGCRALE